MFLVHVYPLLRGVAPHTLTYFSQIRFQRGAVIMAKLRNREVPVIVARCESAKDARTRLRRQDHELSPIKKQEPHFPFHAALLDAVEKVAAENAAPAGALLEIFVGKSTPKNLTSTMLPLCEAQPLGMPDKRAVQAAVSERDELLHTMARELLAQQKSLLVVTPTRHEALRIHRALAALPHEHVVVLHGNLTARTLKNELHRAQEPGTKVIIASQSHAAVPRADFGLCYIESSTSPYYSRDVRPLADMRDVFD
ncbi:MAG: hypothetical protein KBE09_05065, partial [Candidatus Pacebacteria bacterium]|nr:hypothetical protein [Candidatus Paceibacterota bacterium]